MAISLDRHNIEINQNLEYWNSKILLRKIYHDFYLSINENIDRSVSGHIVELGSGIGKIKTVITDCITTDLFPNPWIDRVESVYDLTFETSTVSSFILFDVFHHLEYPIVALMEMHRALMAGGRIILVEPSLSVLGLLVYGLFHHEPLGMWRKIKCDNRISESADYYAAQGNAYRLFKGKAYTHLFNTNFKILKTEDRAAISYILSGGYRGKQLYKEKYYLKMKKADKLFDHFPKLFATRLLIVLEKI